MKETHQVRRARCRNDNTFRNFYFVAPEISFCEYRRFRKPVKHIVLPPISTLPHDNHQSPLKISFRRLQPPSLMTTAATPAPTAYPRNCDRAIGRTHRHHPRLPSLSLRVILRLTNGGPLLCAISVINRSH